MYFIDCALRQFVEGKVIRNVKNQVLCEFLFQRVVVS